jgi:imidazolonepropionase-like amidohydrolase
MPIILIPVLFALGASAEEFVIKGTRVIDATGRDARESVSVHVRDGRIAAIGREIETEGIRVLDGSGTTLLPGLMDTHAHFVVAPGSGFRGDSPTTIRDLNRHHLRAYLACGVTTVMDPGGYPPVVRDVQAWLSAGNPGPRFLTTGPYFRVPGGYGSELHYGTDATPADVEKKLDLIQSLGGIGVKFGLDAGATVPEGELLEALQTGAKRRRLPLYIHATSEEYQSLAIDLGAHAIMHAPLQGRWVGQLVDPDDLSEASIKKLAKSGAYQLTTFGLIDHWVGRFSRDRLDDPLVQLVVPPMEIHTARNPESDRYFAVSTIGWAMPWTPEFLRPAIGWVVWNNATLADGMRYAQRNVRRLYEAGIPIVAATDVPSPWDGSSTFFHGPGMLRELELIVEAGIPPMDAIVAATRTPAEMLGLASEVGTVEKGKVADLLIVEGNPLRNIRALRNIRWTVREGELRTPGGWMAR